MPTKGSKIVFLHQLLQKRLVISDLTDMRRNCPWKGEIDPTATAMFSWYRPLHGGCRLCPHMVSEPWLLEAD